MCYRQSSLDKIIQLCENNQTCIIQATTNFFGDPCLGVSNEQIFIQYQCFDKSTLSQLYACPVAKIPTYVCNAITNSTTQFQKQWCEPTSTAEITCPIGKLINILCAYYGIDINYKCSNGFYRGSPDACWGADSYQSVFSACQKKRTCSFSGNPSFESGSSFTNWCPGICFFFNVYWLI